MSILCLLLLIAVANQSQDSLSIQQEKEIKQKNPTVALFLSLLPGGGQFYTENYIKGAVFGTAQAYFGGVTIYLHLKAQEAKRKKYDAWKWDYEWYSNERNNYMWWSALVWALSMADAYVSAHFYKFKEQGSIRLETGYRGYGPGFYLTKSF